MTAPIVTLIPHGRPGHFVAPEACRECREELAELNRVFCVLAAHGYATAEGSDEYGDPVWRITPEGMAWLKEEAQS